MGIEDRSSRVDLPPDITTNAWGAWFPQLSSVTVIADDLVIPVTHAYVDKVTGADAEACTLANGERGQLLTVELGTDGGGTATITPVTSSGWATVAFADAGDKSTFLYVDDTVGWIMLASSGLTAQPTVT